MRKPFQSFTLFLFSAALLGALSFGPFGLTPSADAGDKHAEAIKNLPAKYRQWLTEDAVYIITDHEKAGFLKLETDALRDKFIEAFWEIRDPTPGTQQNEFKIEHYKRIREANELFGRTAAKTGWKTTQGKLYIQLGKPMHRESFAMDGRLYPIERWFYQTDKTQGFPPFLNLLLFKPYGAGEFELYDPVIHGPEKLVGGILYGEDTNTLHSDRQFALEKIAEVSREVMQASMSVLPDDPVDLDRMVPSMSSRRVLGRLEDFNNRQSVDDRYVDRLLTGEPAIEVEYSFRNMGMVGSFIGAFTAEGATALHYSIEIPPESLTLQRYGQEISGALEVVGRIFGADGREPVVQIDEQVEIAFPRSEFERLKRNPAAFEDVVPLLPGRYRADLIVRNRVTREFGVVEGRFEIPDTRSDLSLSTPMVSSQSRPAPDVRTRPFALGERIFHPVARVPANSEILTVVQIRYPKDRYQVGDALLVRAAITDGTTEHTAGSERLRLNPEYQGDYAVASVRGPVKDLKAGSYRLKVTVEDEKGHTATSSSPLTVYIGGPPPAAWVYANPRQLDPGQVAVAYADQYQVHGDETASLASLEQAVAWPSVEGEARSRLAELRMQRKEYPAAVAAIEPLATRPSASSYTLLLLGLARSGAGDSAGAIHAYERAVAVAPHNTKVLNVLAEEQLRTGLASKAVITLEKSLAADPKQPELKSLLEQAKALVPVGPE